MGIPTYFRYLFEEHGPELLSYSIKEIDYLFFDFNSILYNVFYKSIEDNQKEEIFLENIYKELETICLEINPKVEIYLFIDGPVPRAKMVQQRSRRYKSIQLQKILKKENHFNPSNNICPGTEFMFNLQIYLKNKFENLENKLKYHPKIFMNDSNTFGEGEHKMMPLIRNMNKNRSLCVMSPDNDLLSLLILTGKKNIYLFRIIDTILKKMIRNDTDSRFIFISIDTIREKFYALQQKKITSFENLDIENILMDYNFLLSMVGNDFVQVLPYMRIKSGGMDILLSIYTNLINQSAEYLIDKNTFSINQEFLKKIVYELSKGELARLKKVGSFIDFEKNKKMENKEKEKLEDKINHIYLCNPNSPLYEIYAEDFDKRIFDGSLHEIKKKYYTFFGIRNRKEKIEMIKEYLKSLKFTLLYYNQECPSYQWFYKYRCAPLFSDIFELLCNVNINDIFFDGKGEICTPFQQLLYILPFASKNILPVPFHYLFTKYKLNYPQNFKVDALQGLKYIYSEAILPEFRYEKSMKNDIQIIESSLSEKEKARNKILI